MLSPQQIEQLEVVFLAPFGANAISCHGAGHGSDFKRESGKHERGWFWAQNEVLAITDSGTFEAP